MLPLTRTLRLSAGPRSAVSALRSRSYATNPSGQRPVDDTPGATSTTKTASDKVTVNDPQPGKQVPNVSRTNEVPMGMQGLKDGTMQELTVDAEERRTMQAPNRAGTWSRSQMPRERAMSGPRFEQTIMEMQPRPYAAIELIHKQPVRWTKDRFVSCDGGGGPLGHPRIFINVDKPQICMCTYCGVPYANTQHRKTLEALPQTTYPLDPQGDPAEVHPNDPQKVTNDSAYAQR